METNDIPILDLTLSERVLGLHHFDHSGFDFLHAKSVRVLRNPSARTS